MSQKTVFSLLAMAITLSACGGGETAPATTKSPAPQVSEELTEVLPTEEPNEAPVLTEETCEPVGSSGTPQGEGDPSYFVVEKTSPFFFSLHGEWGWQIKLLPVHNRLWRDWPYYTLFQDSDGRGSEGLGLTYYASEGEYCVCGWYARHPEGSTDPDLWEGANQRWCRALQVPAPAQPAETDPKK